MQPADASPSETQNRTREGQNKHLRARRNQSLPKIQYELNIQFYLGPLSQHHLLNSLSWAAGLPFLCRYFSGIHGLLRRHCSASLVCLSLHQHPHSFYYNGICLSTADGEAPSLLFFSKVVAKFFPRHISSNPQNSPVSRGTILILTGQVRKLRPQGGK